MRAFIAVDLPAEVKTALGDVINRLSKGIGFTGSQLNWVPAENLHFTLKFLGEIDGAPKTLEAIQEVLAAAVTEEFPLIAHLQELACFPKPQRPRSIALGINPKAHRLLERVAAHLEEHLAAIGYAASDRPFVPHLTLGRFKFVKQIKGVQQILANHQKLTGQTFPIEKIYLMESDLSGPLPIYNKILSASLKQQSGTGPSTSV